MSRIRLNQEYRNKIGNRLRVHAEQEDTIEKQNYDNLKADQIDINDKAWKVAETIVRRHYTLGDVAKAQAYWHFHPAVTWFGGQSGRN